MWEQGRVVSMEGKRWVTYMLSGTHNPGPNWSHYGALRGRFITGLDRGDSLEICCLAPCRSEKVAHKEFLFSRLLNAEMANVKTRWCTRLQTLFTACVHMVRWYSRRCWVSRHKSLIHTWNAWNTKWMKSSFSNVGLNQQNTGDGQKHLSVH